MLLSEHFLLHVVVVAAAVAHVEADADVGCDDLLYYYLWKELLIDTNDFGFVVAAVAVVAVVAAGSFSAALQMTPSLAAVAADVEFDVVAV